MCDLISGVSYCISNVTSPVGSVLLSLVNKTHMPVHGCNFSVLPNFSKQTLLITDLESPMSQNVEIFFTLMIVWKSAVHLWSV